MLNMDVEKPHIQRTDLKVTWGEPPRASGAALKNIYFCKEASCADMARETSLFIVTIVHDSTC